MRKIIPLMLAVLGILVGAGVGKLLHHPVESDHADEGGAPSETAVETTAEDVNNPPEYVKMSNQFVVPVLDGGRVTAMVILNLSLEVKTGSTEAVYAREPKLRDAFLQVMFDHANAGGFQGSFTDGPNLTLLRNALKEVAQATVGDLVKDVLVTDLARQDS